MSRAYKRYSHRHMGEVCVLPGTLHTHIVVKNVHELCMGEYVVQYGPAIVCMGQQGPGGDCAV